MIRLVQHTSPQTKLIFLTGHGDNQSALQGLQAGAMGYVHKDTETANLVQAMRDAQRGIRYVSPQVLQRVRKDVPSITAGKPNSPSLTPREEEIVKLLAQGHSVKESAQLLGVSIKTVEAHKFNLMRKLGDPQQSPAGYLRDTDEDRETAHRCRYFRGIPRSYFSDTA